MSVEDAPQNRMNVNVSCHLWIDGTCTWQRLGTCFRRVLSALTNIKSAVSWYTLRRSIGVGVSEGMWGACSIWNSFENALNKHIAMRSARNFTSVLSKTEHDFKIPKPKQCNLYPRVSSVYTLKPCTIDWLLLQIFPVRVWCCIKRLLTFA